MNYTKTLVDAIKDQLKASGIKTWNIDEFETLIAAFITTLFATCTLDRDDDSYEINGFRYSLSDYKVSDVFKAFVMPRGVYAHAASRALNMLVKPTVDMSVVMTPKKFNYFEGLLTDAMRAGERNVSDLKTLSEALTIAVALEGDCVRVTDRNEEGKERIYYAMHDLSDYKELKRIPVVVKGEYFASAWYNVDSSEVVAEWAKHTIKTFIGSK